ncbi:hypothetical protein ACI2J9_13725 [Pseudomonas fulva]|uniref:hypothetical protein n=1 Tax=Pseudomonas fulva TaxID=47880 RepID=UPI00384B9F1C
MEICIRLKFYVLRSHLSCWINPGIKKALALMVFLGLNGEAHAFEVYGFIPYDYRVQHGELVEGRPSSEWFENLGIHSIDVVYERRMINVVVDKMGKKSFVLNRDMMKDVGLGKGRKKTTIVSLDLESWDRFDTQTPTRLLETIQSFRKVNNDTPLGLYATVPQNTYIWQADKKDQYDQLNSKYASVADAVDYFSPSLYNYSKDDYAGWLDGAKYNIAAAKKYSKEKKVIPYITPEIWEDGYTRWLSYDEMKKRLQALKDLGVDGCIVWASSRSRSLTGEKPALDPGFGWFKAVTEFSGLSHTTTTRRATRQVQ